MKRYIYINEKTGERIHSDKIIKDKNFKLIKEFRKTDIKNIIKK